MYLVNIGHSKFMTPLIMTADDYAQSAEIDNGILQLIAMGRLTAASCLVLSPRWPQAAKLLSKEVRDKADIGLHLDFTQFPHDLTHDLGALIVKSTLRLLPITQVRQVIQRQLDAFEDALGTPPDYVDGHQHVHQLPQIREALIEELSVRYSHCLPWIRVARPPLNDGFKALVIRSLGASALEKLALDNGFVCSKTLLGVYGFNATAAQYRQHLAGWLSTAAQSPSPIALMCHPAAGALRISQTDDTILPARLVEYEVTAAPEFAGLLQDNHIQLVRGSYFKLA
jgi:predicted glycoside hydrolase/deacetylase ChbG (UPF0249 family)